MISIIYVNVKDFEAAILMNMHGYLPLPSELMMVKPCQLASVTCVNGNHRNHTKGNATGAFF